MQIYTKDWLSKEEVVFKQIIHDKAAGFIEAVNKNKDWLKDYVDGVLSQQSSDVAAMTEILKTPRKMPSPKRQVEVEHSKPLSFKKLKVVQEEDEEGHSNKSKYDESHPGANVLSFSEEGYHATSILPTDPAEYHGMLPGTMFVEEAMSEFLSDQPTEPMPPVSKLLLQKNQQVKPTFTKVLGNPVKNPAQKRAEDEQARLAMLKQKEEEKNRRLLAAQEAKRAKEDELKAKNQERQQRVLQNKTLQQKPLLKTTVIKKKVKTPGKVLVEEIVEQSPALNPETTILRKLHGEYIFPAIPDDDESPQKQAYKIPEWAHPRNLHSQVRLQQNINPDQVFPRLKPIDLDVIFAENKDTIRRVRMRTSSANWSADKLTTNDIDTYNLTMGFQQVVHNVKQGVDAAYQ